MDIILTVTNLHAAEFMETHKDELKPQPHDLDWKDICSDKTLQVFGMYGSNPNV